MENHYCFHPCGALSETEISGQEVTFESNLSYTVITING